MYICSAQVFMMLKQNLKNNFFLVQSKVQVTFDSVQ